MTASGLPAAVERLIAERLVASAADVDTLAERYRTRPQAVVGLVFVPREGPSAAAS